MRLFIYSMLTNALNVFKYNLILLVSTFAVVTNSQPLDVTRIVRIYCRRHQAALSFVAFYSYLTTIFLLEPVY